MQYDADYLKMLQSLPLEAKVLKTKQRIHEFVMEFGRKHVYVSFSGGKDSAVLLHLVRQTFPEIPGVFFNTGVEFPELVRHTRQTENVIEVKPKRSIRWIIEHYGYPVISKEISERLNSYWNGKTERARENGRNAFLGIDKNGNPCPYKQDRYSPWAFMLESPFKVSHMCCYYLKKTPSARFERKTNMRPMVATLASESAQRTRQWKKQGCNAFARNGVCKRDISQPMAFWRDTDVLEYIREYTVPIPSLYGDIVECGDRLRCTRAQRTGCMYCGFGAHHPDDKRFDMLSDIEPAMYEYAMGGGAFDDRGIWGPKKGLGYRYVIDWIAEQRNKK